jgi:hypothetical protein
VASIGGKVLSFHNSLHLLLAYENLMPYKPTLRLIVTPQVFLINLNCWSKHGQRCHHLKNKHSPIITLRKSNTLSLVKTLAKGDKPIDVNVLFWNFGHILQILSKHSKFCQYKSIAEFPGAHSILGWHFKF